MFEKMAAYLDTELINSTHDYELLEKLNLTAATKYKAMADRAVTLV